MRGADVILPAVASDAEHASMRRISVVRVAGGALDAAIDAVAVEAPLEVRLDGQPFAVTMRTPGADRALAAGFLFTEGIVAGAADIAGITEGVDVVDVAVTPARAAIVAAHRVARRQVTTTSSCGMCGRPDLASTRLTAPVLAAADPVGADVVVALPARLAARQTTFAETGGLHAAALCDRDGRVIDSAEDVGRHNAVDKIVGRRLLAGALPAGDGVLIVSGRTSFEIVQKAWLAGIPIVAAVSAPSSLAIELAEEAGITLIGFVRGDRFNVYTHAGRVVPRHVHA
jgi:FdhD protein